MRFCRVGRWQVVSLARSVVVVVGGRAIGAEVPSAGATTTGRARSVADLVLLAIGGAGRWGRRGRRCLGTVVPPGHCLVYLIQLRDFFFGHGPEYEEIAISCVFGFGFWFWFLVVFLRLGKFYGQKIWGGRGKLVAMKMGLELVESFRRGRRCEYIYTAPTPPPKLTKTRKLMPNMDGRGHSLDGATSTGREGGYSSPFSRQRVMKCPSLNGTILYKKCGKRLGAYIYRCPTP